MMKKSEYRAMIVTLANVYARRRIDVTGRYEVSLDVIYDAIAERANNSGYKFSARAIARDVRSEMKAHYGRSNLPELMI